MHTTLCFSVFIGQAYFCIFILVMYLFFCSPGLQCWACVNMESDTQDSVLHGGLSLKSDPNCVNPQSGVTKYNTCPDNDIYKCGYIEAQVKASYPICELSYMYIKINVECSMSTNTFW